MQSNMLHIAFIGAGFVNFGGGEGPWDHASRIEQLDGVRVVAICDLDEALARRQLERRRHGPYAEVYAGCTVFTDWEAMLDKVTPDAVFIGLPPNAHGKMSGKQAVEVGCARHGVHMFIEKPLSNGDPEEARQVCEHLKRAQSRHGAPLIVSVGYMLRYSNMVNHLQGVLRVAAADGRPPRVFSGRYCSAYSNIRMGAFWDTRLSGGPIVEQATHFVDMARYLLGEVEQDSVSVVTIPPEHPLSCLVDEPLDVRQRPIESYVPAEYHPPRATIATWRFASGAVGLLTHGILQHGNAYEAELEVWGDGLKVVLSDPYSAACSLAVRDGDFRYQATPIEAANDPYLTEDAAFIQAVRENRPNLIRSPYEDALRTFELTCRITERSAPAPAAR